MNIPTRNGRKLRILLIEDHADTLETVTLLLRRFGHDVVPAACCADARAHVASPGSPIEAIVGDLGLPDGDGLDLLVDLKRQYNCPTIALTAYGMDSDVRRCTAAGVDRHLLKPVGVIELAGALDALCPQPVS